MNSLRLKITLLVMGAIIAMSIIGIAASFSVNVTSMGANSSRVVFRYNAPAPEPATAAQDVPDTFLGMRNIDLHGLPPRVVIIGYALLIVAGSAAVGLIVANMVVRPLQMLEDAVNSVNPEGFIPRLDEKGLGEDLEVSKLINKLSDSLKSAMETRMRLVAAAGHDLRTPMTRMRLRAEFMDDEEEREKWIRDIDEMLHIADSAIRLVREESGLQSTEMIDLDVLLHDLCLELSEIGHPVVEGVLVPLRVRGGLLSLKRAASNLIVNAATHGGSATVSLRKEGDVALLEIFDDGPGIPEEMIGRAFEPFFSTAPARHKSMPGAGLGLAIAKEIVTRHGGCITLANRPEGGLLQTIALPLAV